MGLNHFILLFLLGFLDFSLGKECPECPEDLDVNDPIIQNYLIIKLDQLKNVTPEGTTDDKEMQLIRLNRAVLEVSQGIQFSFNFEAKGLNTNQMYVCNLTLFRQFDISPDSVIGYSCDLVSNIKKGLLPGEDIVVDVQNNNDLEELKSFLSQEISKVQHSEYLMIVMEYVKAKVEIVEGMLLKTTVYVGTTNCHRNVDSADSQCQEKLQAYHVCNVKVWLKPWMHYKEVIEVECQPVQLLSEICAGCPIEKDPNSPFIKQYLEKTLYKLNEGSRPEQKLTLVKINKATSQVINGVKLTIYFDAEKSNKNYNCKTVIILAPSSEEHVVEDFNCNPVPV